MREIIIASYEKLQESGYEEDESFKIIKLIFGEFMFQTFKQFIDLINTVPADHLDKIDESIKANDAVFSIKELRDVLNSLDSPDEIPEKIEQVVDKLMYDYLKGEDLFQ